MSLPWYRRFPGHFLIEASDLTLEEKGAFSIIIDLIYMRGGRAPDEPRYLAGLCSCSTHRWKAIRATLLAKGKLRLVGNELDAPIVHQWVKWAGREAIPAHVRRAVFERDGERCVYCGAVDGPFHLDHVFPFSRGGSTTIENLVVACVPCNLSKGSKMPEEWLQ